MNRWSQLTLTRRVVLSVLAAVAFVLAGVGFLAGLSWWAAVAIGASVVSLVLIALTFTPWFLAGVLIDVVIVVLAWRNR